MQKKNDVTINPGEAAYSGGLCPETLATEVSSEASSIQLLSSTSSPCRPETARLTQREAALWETEMTGKAHSFEYFYHQ